MYDCSTCEKLKFREEQGLVCFIKEKKVTFDVPQVNFEGTIPTLSKTRKTRIVDIEGFYELLDEFRELSPDTPLALVLKRHFKDICIRSVVDMSDRDIISLEAFCSEYGCLPHEGGMLDQLDWIVEAFNTIRGARNEYEKIKQKEMQKKLESKK